MRILLIDNFDSFTFNLFQLVAEQAGSQPIVVRNDASWSAIPLEEVDAIVVSPGPGHPSVVRDLGISAQALTCGLPVLGVCMGHQGLGLVEGGSVIHAPEPVHGRISRIFHDEDPLFAGILQGSEVVRYHSFILGEPLPPSLRRIAWTDDGLIMSVAHRDRPAWGIQYHPESICTAAGAQLIANFIALANAHARVRSEPNPSRGRRLKRMSVVPEAASVADSGESWRLTWARTDIELDAEAWYASELAARRHQFWLDSSAVADGVRFSFLGHVDDGESAVITYSTIRREIVVETHGRSERRQGSIFELIDDFLAARKISNVEELPFEFTGGLVGHLGYELKTECGATSAREAATAAATEAVTDDATLLFVDRFVVIDHLEHKTYAVAIARASESAAAHEWCRSTIDKIGRVAPASPLELPELADIEPLELAGDRDREQYLRDIATCLESIRNGESYELCLTAQFSAKLDIDPVVFYRVLRRLNPAPYGALIRYDDTWVASSSPERFIRIDAERNVESKPIKGTRRRGSTQALDEALRDELATSIKDRAENLMIVDLVRNDLGVVCEIGSVHVPALMHVESYASVHQLVSTIRGKLRSGISAAQCVRYSFPGGSMTGAPKLRAMEILDRLEPSARGAYSGAIGYFSTNGAVDLSIVIRTAVIADGTMSIGAGGAIVALSDPAEEIDEVALKSRVLRHAAAVCVELARPSRRERRGATG